ncbi:Hypothetical predicted protein [Olea europaea subsp. europaea]|uniref:Uncharacterized protein n=1 Tax=Olea europaea subsp. europaea TaxID=158383 RepID=A0A8S0V1I1_OLEEU|nr:Hypothetical predicted protein [Olea europaea subsp. europaea]
MAPLASRKGIEDAAIDSSSGASARGSLVSSVHRLGDSWFSLAPLCLPGPPLLSAHDGEVDPPSYCTFSFSSCCDEITLRRRPPTPVFWVWMMICVVLVID